MIFNRTLQKWKEFVESVRYRDFSRHYPEKGLHNTRKLHGYFNEIMRIFKDISREKETQYQYLQNILQLVDTGILSYEEEQGDVVWMNESLKKLLLIPYLKNISSLEKRNKLLHDELLTLVTGNNKVVSLQINNITYKILISATSFKEGNKTFRLIAFQNIQEAVEETESQAWQKLLRVLTHEIMNSVAPISSLASTLQQRLEQNDNTKEEDLKTGLETIRHRSEGLLQFAQTYRNLSKITSLKLTPVPVSRLFGNIIHLVQPMLDRQNIELEIIQRDMQLTLEADLHLLEQVLINLIINASEAVNNQQNPRIVLSAYMDTNGHCNIKVADNGVGISKENIDQVFVPFFTTKKNGSGIGLSLCRQIMSLHQGSITVQSEPNIGSSFTLVF